MACLMSDIFPPAFLRSFISTNYFFIIWYFYHLAFLLMAFSPEALYHLAFVPIVHFEILPLFPLFTTGIFNIGIFTCDIFIILHFDRLEFLSFRIFTNGIFTVCPF